MSEAELATSAALFFDLAVSAIALYVTICSGFLATAYLVGSKITRSQTFIISGLFVFVASLMTYGVFGWFWRAFLYNQLLFKLDPNYLPTSGGTPMAGWVLSGIMAIGIFACLKFMWDVRHP